MTLAAALICVLFADLLTGIVHWWEDTYGRPSWPFLGWYLIEPNLAHHLRPSSLQPSWWGRNGHTFAAAVLVAAVLMWSGMRFAEHLALVVVLASWGNEVHAWAHGVGRGRVAELLQEMGVVQSPAHHAHHHRSPHDRRFCTLTNALNPVLDAVGFWRGLEVVIALAGVPPARGSIERGGR